MKDYFSRIKKALRKTRDNFSILDSDFSWEHAEEALLLADIGPNLTFEILDSVKKEISEESPYAIKAAIKTKLKSILRVPKIDFSPPKIILLVGINGSGKTTTAGKLAKILKERGKVLLVAADTFRAAAREQLEKLSYMVEVDFFSGEGFSDPAAVAFEACKKNYPYIIIDTAGRLHTKENLMKEAVKIKGAVEKSSGKVPLIFLVLDGTIGQNSIVQAREFSSALKVDGLIVTKLDGTAKGGAIIPISMQLKIPIIYLGVGEGMEDLVPFDPSSFVEAIFGA